MFILLADLLHHAKLYHRKTKQLIPAKPVVLAAALLYPRVGIPVGQELYKPSKETFLVPKSF